MPAVHHIVLFASGTGSNVENIINYFQAHPQIAVKLVVSNNAGSGALQKAAAAGINTLIIPKEQLTNGDWMVQQLTQHNIDFVVLAGYLKMVPLALIRAYHGKMINIHPALLPKFGGKGMYGHHVHEAVLSAAETETGITVHEVTEHYDEGKILAQKKVILEKTDTAAEIEQKVRALEMSWYPVIIESVILQKTLL